MFVPDILMAVTPLTRFFVEGGIAARVDRIFPISILID
jgi:hypothetical protein